MPEVRTATRDDVKPLSRVLAQAFSDDPPFQWLLPDDATRLRRAQRLFAIVLRSEAIAHGAVDVITEADQIIGGAVWFPPGAWPAPVASQLRALPAYLAVLGRRFRPAIEMMGAMVKVHPAAPHWYLYAVGVAPARQASGVGGQLLRYRLGQIDARGGEAYLESSKPQNVPLYEHLGFAATTLPELPAGVPIITPMRRPPQS